MSQTISGYHNTIQTLTSPTATVASTGTIKAGGTLHSGAVAALYGPALETFTVTNFGVIDDPLTSTHAAVFGVDLSGSSTFNNQGTVISGGYGVELYGAGYVHNQKLIEGLYEGVRLSDGGSINNSGTIEATGNHTSFGTLSLQPAGIALLKAGNVSNSASGMISGVDGISIEGSAGSTAIISNSGTIDGSLLGVAATIGTSINNSGLIEGTSSTLVTVSGDIFAGIGLDVAGGGVVTNQLHGIIRGNEIGVVLEAASTGAASINNSGLIAGTGTTFSTSGKLLGSTGIYLVNGGTVTNQATGTITGYGSGIDSFAFIGPAGERSRNVSVQTSIINSGLIEGSNSTIILSNGTVQSSAGGIALNGGGAVTNEASGLIKGNFGIYLNGGSKSIVNSIDNLGTIDGLSSSGVMLGENASLTNSGHIIGATYGVFLYAANQLSNLAGGTITGVDAGIVAYNPQALASTITNAGAVIGTGTTFVSGGTTFFTWGAELIDGGLFDNIATGLLSGFAGFVGEANTTLINAGTIIGKGGLAVNFAGTADTLVNTGDIQGSVETSSTLPGRVAITNDGTILAQNTAIGIFQTFTTAGAGLVTNAGLISSTELTAENGNTTYTVTAVQLESGATLVNQAGGRITAPGFAVGAFSGTGSVVIDNAGTIDGGAGGIVSGATDILTIVNSGNIASAQGNAVGLGAGGSVTNSATGVITGAGGIEASGSSVFMLNAGKIDVIQFGMSDYTTLTGTSTLDNTGTIITVDEAIALFETFSTAGAGLVENSGLIIQTGTSEVNNGTTFTPTAVQIESGATFVNTSSGTIQANGFGAGDFNQAGAAFINNAGLINGAQGGISSGSTERLTVVNSGMIASTQGIAVGLGAGGSVTNTATGIITGASGIESDAADSFILNEGEINVTKFAMVVSTSQTGASTLENTGTIITAYEAVGLFNSVAVTDGGLVENSGLIKATAAQEVNNGSTIIPTAVQIDTGGTLVNTASGTILSAAIATGDFGPAGAGYINNAGLINGALGGVWSGSTEFLTVVNSGSIISQGPNSAVHLGDGGTIIDSGLIEGTSSAIDVVSGPLTLILETGANIEGGVVANGTGNVLIFGSLSHGVLDLGGSMTDFSTVDVDAGASWAVAGTIASLLVNDGTLTGTAIGIEAAAGSHITNMSAGLITASSGFGLELVAGGSVTNAGHIAGQSAGILASAVATISNSGTITATGKTFVSNGHTLGASAISLLDGGEVTNLAGGEIIGLEFGIGGTSSSGIGVTIDNNGLIESTGTGMALAGTITFAPEAIGLSDGGVITNSSSGTIIGGGFGILLETTLAANAVVLNSGVITAGNGMFVSGLNTYASGGIAMLDGGSVTNFATGKITGAEVGVVFVSNTLKAAGTLINSGLIAATGPTVINDGVISQPIGILLEDGGIVTNQVTGIISGFDGAYLGGGTASIHAYLDNLGSISGTGETGIILASAASLSNAGHINGVLYGALLVASDNITNLAGGSIIGAHAGILANNTLGLASTITNAGAIIGTGSTFVVGGTTYDSWGGELVAGGSFDNEATGTLAGYAGFLGEASTTLINAGTITGRGGLAVYLTGTNDKIIDDPGAVFNGVVYDSTNTGILELGAGAKAGTITAFNSEFTGFGTVSVDAAASWALAGTIASLLDDGTITIASGSSLDISTAVNAASSGIFQLTTKGTLEIASLLGTNVKIQFLGTTPANKLIIDSAANFGVNVGKPTYAGPLLEDFQAGDVIDLKNIASAGLKLNYNATTGDLQITASGGGVVASLQFQNSSLGTGTFHTATDGASGTLLTLS